MKQGKTKMQNLDRLCLYLKLCRGENAATNWNSFGQSQQINSWTEPSLLGLGLRLGHKIEAAEAIDVTIFEGLGKVFSHGGISTGVWVVEPGGPYSGAEEVESEAMNVLDFCWISVANSIRENLYFFPFLFWIPNEIACNMHWMH